MILRQYCVVFPNYFTPHEVDKIHAVANQIETLPGLIGNKDVDPDSPDPLEGNDDRYIRQSEIKWIEHSVMPNEIQQRITDGVNQASIDADWLHQWDHVENHQYTIYKHRPDAPVTGDFYTWHTDAGEGDQSPGGRRRKLSSTIQLSDADEYEGGRIVQLSKESVRQHYIESGHHSELYEARQLGTTEPPIPALPEHLIESTAELYASMFERLTGEAL